MNDFKVGDKVEYVGNVTTRMIGKVGVVVDPPFANSGMVYFDHGGAEPYGAYPQSLTKLPSQGPITINRAEDSAVVALDALELHGVPPTDTGGWRTAMEQSFQSTSDDDLVYTAWLHLKALSLRTARKQAAEEAAALLSKRRNDLAKEVAKKAEWNDWEHASYCSHQSEAQAAIDMLIAEYDRG